MPSAGRYLALLCWSATAGGCTKSYDTQSDLPHWSIEAQPILDIGDEVDGSVESAGDVIGATRMDDGGIIVADRASSSLKFFSPQGQLIRSVGRKGHGPGEFAQMATMLRCGDSLYVFDAGIRKYAVYSLNGEWSRQFALATPGAREVPYRPVCNAHGTTTR